MLRSLLTICAYLFNYYFIIYLGNNFYQKKLSRKNYLFIFTIFFIVVFAFSTFFYNYSGIKVFSTLSLAFIIYKKYYLSSTRKAVICIILYMIALFLSEAVSTFIFILISPDILKSGVYNMNALPRGILYLTSNILIYLILKISLYFTRSTIQFSKSYLKTFCILLSMISLSSYIAIFCVAQDYNFELEFSISIPISSFIIFLFLSWFIAIIIFIIELKKLTKKIEKEILMQKTVQQYQEQIDIYLQEKNNFNYQFLRHDIMNYIQTYATLIHDEKVEK